MKLLVQCVDQASVVVEGAVVGQIDRGALIFIGVERDDTADTCDRMVQKMSKLRVFSDSEGKTNLSLAGIGGSALVVSQFTLAANLKKGNRPSFDTAAAPDVAESLYLRFVEGLRQTGIPVETGRFRADMKVQLINDGPSTYGLSSN